MLAMLVMLVSTKPRKLRSTNFDSDPVVSHLLAVYVSIVCATNIIGAGFRTVYTQVFQGLF